MPENIPTYLYLNFVCNLACKFCASDETNSKREVRWFTLQDIKQIFVDRYFEKYPSQILLISGGEPTIHIEFLEIIKYLRQKFPIICLMTNGVKLSNKNYLHLVIENGIKNFSTPVYGQEKLHDYLTGTKCYNSTNKFINSIYQKILNKESIHLDVKLLFTKHNYKYNPLLIKKIINKYGNNFSYSLNGLFRSNKVLTTDSYISPLSIKKYITSTIETLKEYKVPIRLSYIPLCSIEGSLLKEILLDLFIQFSKDSKFVYYIRPDCKKVRKFSNITYSTPQCNNCDVNEICTKFSGINSNHYKHENVSPIKL